MILNESTTSIVMPGSPIVLGLKKFLKTQVVLESLSLRLILHEIVFKGFLFLKPFISHCQEYRHCRALRNVLLLHWLITPVMRNVRAFTMRKSFRGFLLSIHPHFFDLSRNILHGPKKDLKEFLLFIFS